MLKTRISRILPAYLLRMFGSCARRERIITCRHVQNRLQRGLLVAPEVRRIVFCRLRSPYCRQKVFPLVFPLGTDIHAHRPSQNITKKFYNPHKSAQKNKR